MALISGPLGQKRLELVRDLVPKATVVAMLANPSSADAVPEIREVQAAAQANGLQLRMLNASAPGEIDAAFALFTKERPDALLVGTDPFYMTRRERVRLTSHRFLLLASRRTVVAGRLRAHMVRASELTLKLPGLLLLFRSKRARGVVPRLR
jgi:putative tryptophan/tyrosine transport system substrate-binding protein